MFYYSKAFLGKILKTGEFVMIEKYIKDTFAKYINNDGTIIDDDYFYQKSKEELLFVDIQGCDYALYDDPEIASVKSVLDENGFCFSLGNLCTMALENFKKIHK